MIINLAPILLLMLILTSYPSYATEGAPEIPAGIGPLVISGIVLFATAIKSFKEKKK